MGQLGDNFVFMYMYVYALDLESCVWAEVWCVWQGQHGLGEVWCVGRRRLFRSPWPPRVGGACLAGADGQVLHLRICGCCSQWSGPGPWVVCVVGQRGLAEWGIGKMT